MKNEIEQILAEETKGTPLYVVECDIMSHRVDVYMDADGGLNLEDCAKMNRRLHERLEEKGIDTGQFMIDVSSPGIDRPLTILRDYKKNVGRKLEIQDTQGKTISGLLVFVDAEHIILKNGKGAKAKNESINFNQIAEAKTTI